jgi:hypothetical protein
METLDGEPTAPHAAFAGTLFISAALSAVAAFGAIAASPHARHAYSYYRDERAPNARQADPDVTHPSCGEYKYWHDRKCMDARDKPRRSRMTRVF